MLDYSLNFFSIMISVWTYETLARCSLFDESLFEAPMLFLPDEIKRFY